MFLKPSYVKAPYSTETTIDNLAFCLENMKFKFPPPPKINSIASVSPCSVISTSESSLSDTQCKKVRRRNKCKTLKVLPSIGIFWDIENCQVPKNKNATLVVRQIRELFCNDYREAEFLVVCDVKKESSQIVSDLNDAQVNLIHVSSISKNAADEKLRQSLRRFSELHKVPAAVALISGDVNFAADLSDLRYRKKLHVILIHNNNVADALILCANETYNFTSIIERVPTISKTKPIAIQQADLLVFNLPINATGDTGRLKTRLKLLSDNCGGRVLAVYKDLGYAVIRFISFDCAKRAQKRLDGEYVFGNKIQVSQPMVAREGVVKSRTGKKLRNDDTVHITQIYNKTENPNDFYSKRIVEVYKYLDSNEDIKRQPIQLIISNLDSSINGRELWRLLLNKLKQYVMVLNLTINTKTDGSLIAVVTIASEQEAQSVISHLHDQQLGDKHITVSYMQCTSESEQLRGIVRTLLQEAPNNHMPLIKFFGLVESRFHYSVSVSDLYQLKDVCKIITGHSGRIISLSSKAVIPLPLQLEKCISLHAYCTIHCPNGQESGNWGESEQLDISLPNIRISLKQLHTHLKTLLHSHSGYLPLLSFPICYAVEFGQPLPEDENGVPLEHLITCVPNVELACDKQNKNIKYIKPKTAADVKREGTLLKSITLTSNISTFCREVVDLLQTIENCQLLLLRFIPTYHHHFGRQCRVGDYGFTRLIDLFEEISHVVQILGYGSKRTITLTHSVQMRKFTSDLLLVLNGQVSKHISLSNFGVAYEKILNKAFNPIEYGLCSFDDLINGVPEGTVIINSFDNVATISISKRKEQTREEEQRIKQFALEVQQLLSHATHHSILFNKFIPCYQHHFGRQCRLSDYGFSKLVELFESISDTVDVLGDGDVDRKIKLKLNLALKVLGGQIQSIIKESSNCALSVEEVFATFKQKYGYVLKPEMYNAKNHLELALKLSDFVQVSQCGAGTILTLSDVDISTLIIRVWSLLIQPPHMSTITKFIYDYRVRFLETLAITKLEQMKSVIVMSNNGAETIVSLTSYYTLAARLYHLLFVNGGHIFLNDMDDIYFRKFGNYLCPSKYGVCDLEDLFRQMSCIFTLLTTETNQLNVVLNKNLADYSIPLPSVYVKESRNGHQPASNCLYNNFCCFTSPEPETTLHDGWCNFTINNESNSLQNDFQSLHDSISSTLSATIPKISSPHPTNLPTPDKLIFHDDTGVNTFRNYTIARNTVCSLKNEQIKNGDTARTGNLNVFNFKV